MVALIHVSQECLMYLVKKLIKHSSSIILLVIKYLFGYDTD